ncbi:MAG: HAD-IB family phosphatase [bacterium]|nr:HAD-IB family phosphatase [bacterium]
MNTKKVAIFDVDGTIFRSSLLIETVETLIEEGVFPPESRAVYEKEKIRWLERKGDYESYIMAVVEAFLKHIKGIHYADFKRAINLMILKHKDRTYKYTKNLIAKLKRQRYYLLAISQSPKAVLDPFCKRLGFDKVYGRIYEIGPTDRFTGKITDEHLIGNKANIVKRVVEKEGLTLSNSVGVGDTEGDISFLEMVARPICFNPNHILYKHAKRNGWKVVVERKDVVYEI